MAAPTSSRERARRRTKRGEQSRERSWEVGGAFTHSGGEGGRRRKILGQKKVIRLVKLVFVRLLPGSYNDPYVAYLGIEASATATVTSLSPGPGSCATVFFVK